MLASGADALPLLTLLMRIKKAGNKSFRPFPALIGLFVIYGLITCFVFLQLGFFKFNDLIVLVKGNDIKIWVF